MVVAVLAGLVVVHGASLQRLREPELVVGSIVAAGCLLVGAMAVGGRPDAAPGARRRLLMVSAIVALVAAAVVTRAPLALRWSVMSSQFDQVLDEEPPAAEGGGAQYVDSAARGLGFGITSVTKYGNTMVFTAAGWAVNR